MDQRTISRAKVLESFGASDGEVPEILAYNENRFAPLGSDVPQFPLPDEPFVAAWDQYAREVREARGIAPLAKYLVQLQLPVQHGVTGSPDYIPATRREGKDAGLARPLRPSLTAPPP